MSIDRIPVTVAYGDGIGPEIMEATLRILDAAGAAIEPEVIEIGESVYLRGHSSGIEDAAWDSLRRTRVFLKAPITTPQGGGYKSLNVTVRKSLGLFANVRPCRTYDPVVETKHPGMDLVIVRENEEDLYAGIEHRQTQEVVQCLKLVSEAGCRRIVRYAFEYARANGRRTVTCMTKDNIMKLTDGLFHRVFDEIGREYPEIKKEHYIIDIGMARVATQPENFDVIVTLNLYGDILSDITAETSGSVGLGGSANISNKCAMFEAIHGSAPDIAGRGVANPSGLLKGACMMLVHIGQAEAAERIENAWLKTLEDGIHTGDIYQEGASQRRVGTKEFTDEIIARLGQKPNKFAPVHYPRHAKCIQIPEECAKPQHRETVGVDVFLCYQGDMDELANRLKQCETGGMVLETITNRGVVVWPDAIATSGCSDHLQARFRSEAAVTNAEILELCRNVDAEGLDFVKTEHLCTFDGQIGFSLAQGQ